jgi:ectoine hydroxylase-related dioxygenase (phytanoyl-CoA dioxygenase family)
MKDAGRIYNIHFPIFQNSTIENGTMSILLNSHKEGLLPYEKRRLSDDSYTDLIPIDIISLQEKYLEAYCELELGDCLIFDENLIHKSNYNRTNNCRTVGVWRAFGNFYSSTKQYKPDEL